MKSKLILLGYLFIWGVSSLAQATPTRHKILIVPSDDGSEAVTLYNKLFVKGLAIDLSKQPMSKFDPRALLFYDVIFFVDGGHALQPQMINEDVQTAIVQFVKKGGTFIHQLGLAEAFAEEPLTYMIMNDLVLFEPTTSYCQCSVSFEPRPNSSLGAKLFNGVKAPLNVAGCVEAADGNIREFHSEPPELVVLNTDPNPVDHEKMVAVRRVGLGLAVGLNFTTWLLEEDCFSQKDISEDNIIQFFANILTLSLVTKPL